jgi:hypothetical protein
MYSYLVKLLESTHLSRFIVAEIPKLTPVFYPIVLPEDMVYKSCYKAA